MATRRKWGPCKNATLNKDGSVRRECPHGGKARYVELELAGVKTTIRGLCEGCAANLVVEEATAERDRRRLRVEQVAPPRMRDWTLDTYPANEPGREKAKRHALRWLAAVRKGDRRNLVLWGDVGAGKSGLAWGLLREMIETDGLLDVDFVNFRHLLAEIRAGIAEQRRGGERPEFLARRRKRLVVDDVGAERPTDFAREELAELVDWRYLQELPTIYTSNYSLEELGHRLGHDEPVIGHRIASRMLEGSLVVEVRGSDLRAA